MDKMSLESRNRGRKFPQKLWEAVTYNEDGLIYWSSSGKSIIFRYGFRKVKNAERDLHGKPSAALHLQYSREFFQKGRADLLSLIERNPRTPKAEEWKSKIDSMRRSKLNFREQVVKNKLEIVDRARKNYAKVIANSLKAYKNGDKGNFLKKSMTTEGIKHLCENTDDTIVHVTSRVVVLKVQQNQDLSIYTLEDAPKRKQKFDHLIGEWNSSEIVDDDVPICVDKEEVVEYEEKF